VGATPLILRALSFQIGAIYRKSKTKISRTYDGHISRYQLGGAVCTTLRFFYTKGPPTDILEKQLCQLHQGSQFTRNLLKIEQCHLKVGSILNIWWGKYLDTKVAEDMWTAVNAVRVSWPLSTHSTFSQCIIRSLCAHSGISCHLPLQTSHQEVLYSSHIYQRQQEE